MTAIHALPSPTLAERIAALQEQARELTGAQVAELDGLLLRTAELCGEIATCPLHLPGVREHCARMAADAMAARATVVSINSRFSR